DGSDTSAIVKRPRCCKPLNRGYAVDFGRWCGSNGNGDGRDFANFANGVWVKTSRHKLPGVLTDRGGLRTRPLSTSLCRMPTWPRSGFPPWWCGLSLIRRTAVCGPACTVVWQGRRGDPSPYADFCALMGTPNRKCDSFGELSGRRRCSRSRHSRGIGCRNGTQRCFEYG